MTVVSPRFADIRKEMTLFLVIPKRNDQKQCSFSVDSAKKYEKRPRTKLMRLDRKYTHTP